jgi:hypothetical protein
VSAGTPEPLPSDDAYGRGVRDGLAEAAALLREHAMTQLAHAGWHERHEYESIAACIADALDQAADDLDQKRGR